MKTWKEIQEFLDNVDLGEPVYDIAYRYGDLQISMRNWDFIGGLRESQDHWLHRYIARNLGRKYSPNENKIILLDRERLDNNIKREIREQIIYAARTSSPADQPKRTKAYKGMVEVAHANYTDEAFIDDMLPVLNYYYESTNSTTNQEVKKVHTNNTYALLEILRKKYGNNNKDG